MVWHVNDSSVKLVFDKGTRVGILPRFEQHEAGEITEKSTTPSSADSVPRRPTGLSLPLHHPQALRKEAEMNP